MRVLLDECVPRRLRRDLSEHDVRTVAEMGWQGVKNGALLQRAAAEFDAFLTVDQNLQFQQNLTALPLPVIVLAASSSAIDSLRPLMARVKEVLTRLSAGEIYRIES